MWCPTRVDVSELEVLYENRGAANDQDKVAVEAVEAKDSHRSDNADGARREDLRQSR
jgi:hypothetical protein